MTDTPNLPTEQQIRDLHGLPQDALVAFFRAHNLVAPEPVDPLMLEAGKICEAYYKDAGWPQIGEKYRPGGRRFSVNEPQIILVLRALRRGMELRPALTRDMLQEVLDHQCWVYQRESLDALHAALVERLK